MRILKKFIIILCLLVSAQAYGQYPITFNGYVYDSTGTGVPNKTVDIAIFLGFNWTNFTTLTSDVNGNFFFSFSVSDSTADFRFTTTDCLGDSIIWTEFWDSGVSDTLNTSVTICNNSLPSCTASFNYTVSSSIPNTVDFNSLLSPQPSGSAIITWDFGDGDSSNLLNPTHTYADTGSYLVCLLYNDSSINCLYSACLLINVPTLPNNCNTSYTVQNYSPAFAFFGNSNLGGPTVSYAWDFGDGNTSQGLNAVHSYQDPGQYLVCFSAIDSSNNCGYCDSLLVNFDTSQLRIGGTIGGGIASGTNNTMILYQDNNPFIIAMDTTLSVNGNYRFEGLGQGNYLIKCIPGNQSSNPGFIPTYWPSSAYWGDATSLFLTSDQNGVSFNFNSTTVNLNGTGSISVDVKNGAAQPLENSTVWIEDMNQNIMAYEITDNTGAVSFNNLPFDDYHVWADYPGYFMFPYILSPNTQRPNQNLDLKIMGNWITTSFEDVRRNKALKIFPNPSTDYIFINSRLKSEQISITDLTGKEIDFRIEEVNENMTRINFRNSLNGLYLISIKTQKGIISQKLMLKDK